MAAAVVQTVVWTCVMPPLQGPDEVGHFSYSQKIVESGEVPWEAVGWAPERGTRAVSTEVERALVLAAILPSWGNPSARPAATELEERMWESERRELDDADRADGGFTSSMRNPPLYYLYQAVPYAATSSLSVFDRAFVMRLANLPFLVILLGFCWLVAGELLGGVRRWQVLATAAVALQPQLIHLTATVNPDVAVAAAWSAGLYLMIRTLKDGLSRGRVAGMLALVAASALLQPRGAALLIGVVATVALAAARGRRGSLRLTVGALAGVAAVGLVVLFAYAIAGDPSISRARQFVSYLWQFYLPRLGFMDPISPAWGADDAFVDRLFGGYVQLEVAPSPDVLSVLTVAAGAVLVLAAAGIVARRDAIARRPEIAIALAVLVGGYVAVLHVVAFRSLLSGPDPVITGRYLLPLMPLYGAGIALAVSWLPRRLEAVLGTVILTGLIVLQVQALALVYERFYA
jgi:4-amino-4-deoxy-L-arabinose transferase-like glycosyltransferase